jgi:hypothetical protein
MVRMYAAYVQAAVTATRGELIRVAKSLRHCGVHTKLKPHSALQRARDGPSLQLALPQLALSLPIRLARGQLAQA